MVPFQDLLFVMTTLTLEECLAARRLSRPLMPVPSSGEEAGDALFQAGAHAEALDAYAACTVRAPQLDAKQGYCLAYLHRFEEAASYLTRDNCAGSATALAVLALVTAGGWRREAFGWGHGGTSGPFDFAAEAARTERLEAQVADLLDQALSFEKPPSVVFAIYRSVVRWYVDREAALRVAERADALYSIEWLDVWRCGLLRMLGRPDHGALDAVLSHFPGIEEGAETTREAFDTAIALDRFEDASAVIDLEESVVEDGMPYRDFSVMRAFVDLRRGLAGDKAAAARAVATLTAHLTTLPSETALQRRLVLAAQKVRLAAAVDVGDDVVVRASCVAIMDILHLDGDTVEYGPGIEMLSAGRLVHEASFGDGYLAPLVKKALGSGERECWAFHLALRTHLDQDGEDQAALEEVHRHGPAFAPPWALGDVIAVLLSAKSPDPRNAGRLLAMECIQQDGVEDADEPCDLSGFDFDSLGADDLRILVAAFLGELESRPLEAPRAAAALLDAIGHDCWEKKAFDAQRALADAAVGQAEPFLALFHAALARQEMGDLPGARSRYEELLEGKPDDRDAVWNLAIILKKQGDAEALSQLASTALKTAKKDKAWDKTLAHLRGCVADVAKDKEALQADAHRQRALAAFDPVSQDAHDPSDLSLPEATVLLALLRASEQDHANWTLGPFCKSVPPLEPTSRFRQVFFSLLQKGVLGISPSTPRSAFGERDGKPTYAIPELHWTISPATLSLQRAIRDRGPATWPAEWHAHAETFARDVAVEECIRYMAHQASIRNIDAPDGDIMRPVFRGFLENASLGQCFYFIHAGATKAVDYQAKYSARRGAVTTVMQKRIQEMGERALENGWDTAYDRIKALPRTHLEAALHDVLTGWGERAFYEPVRVLASRPLRSGDGPGDA